MNTNQNSKKTILIIVAIVIVGALALFYFMGGSTPDDGSLLSSDSTGNKQVGSKVLSLLNQIESLKIDTSIFTSAAYQTLVDYSVTIPPQNVGRPNPFAPLPGARSGTN